LRRRENSDRPSSARGRQARERSPMKLLNLLAWLLTLSLIYGGVYHLITN
jgi:hypothetical protein